jgi:hypothetical protein
VADEKYYRISKTCFPHYTRAGCDWKGIRQLRNNDVARRKESFVRALSLLLTDTLQVKNRREAAAKATRERKSKLLFSPYVCAAAMFPIWQIALNGSFWCALLGKIADIMTLFYNQMDKFIGKNSQNTSFCG